MSKAAVADSKVADWLRSPDAHVESQPAKQITEINLGKSDGHKRIRHLNVFLGERTDFCIQSWKPPEIDPLPHLSLMGRPLTNRSRIYVFSVADSGCTGFLAVRSLVSVPKAELYVLPPPQHGDLLLTHWGHVASAVSAPQILGQLLEAAADCVKNGGGQQIVIPTNECHRFGSALIGTEGLIENARQSGKFQIDKAAYFYRLRIIS